MTMTPRLRKFALTAHVTGSAGWLVIVPCSFAALLTGLVQSLGTGWGLFRYYGILVKFLLTLGGTLVTPGSVDSLPLWRLVLVLLCVLLPLPGFAQASVPAPPLVPGPPAPEAAPSESGDEDPYGGYEDESEEDKPDDGAPQDEIIPREGIFSGGIRREGLRVITESLLGLTLGLVGVAPGAYLGFVLAASEDSRGSILGVVGLGFVGVTFGSALGVYAGGSLLGGEGRFGMTFIGALLGALAGGILAVPAALVVDSGWIVPVLALPVVGAIIAYESTHEREQERKAAVAGTRIEMVPVISVRPSGGLVAGLAGASKRDAAPSPMSSRLLIAFF